MQTLKQKYVFRTPGTLAAIELGYFVSYEDAEHELLEQYSEYISSEYTYSDGTQYEIYTIAA